MCITSASRTTGFAKQNPLECIGDDKRQRCVWATNTGGFSTKQEKAVKWLASSSSSAPKMAMIKAKRGAHPRWPWIGVILPSSNTVATRKHSTQLVQTQAVPHKQFKAVKHVDGVSREPPLPPLAVSRHYGATIRDVSFHSYRTRTRSEPERFPEGKAKNSRAAKPVRFAIRFAMTPRTEGAR